MSVSNSKRDRTPLRERINVTVPEAAELLGFSATTVREYINQGILTTVKYPSAKHGGESDRVLLPVKELEMVNQQLYHREDGE
jgi:hypothetical protein